MNYLVRDMSLADIWMVCHELPKAEQDVIAAILSAEYNPDSVASYLYQQPGPRWTLDVETPDEGLRVLAVGGCIPQRIGVYRTFFLATREAWREHLGKLTEVAQDYLQRILASNLAHRIETLTLAGRPMTRAWYEQVGLTHEATHRGYCSDGRDVDLFVATRPVEKH
jgi:hypothetical protein